MTNYSHFDKFGTPLMICSSDWKILYKNTNAKKYLKNPRCGVSLDRFFDKTDVEYDNMQRVLSGDDKDSLFILPLVFEDNLTRAISFTYNDCIAVLFPTFVRHQSLYIDIHGFLSEGKSDDFRKILDAFASMKLSKENVSFNAQAAKNAIYDILELMFSKSYDVMEDSDLHPVRDTFVMLKEKLSAYLSVLSYRLFIDISRLSEYSDGYADMKKFIPAFLNIMLFSASLSRDRACNTVVSENDGVFLCEFSFENAKVKLPSVRGNSLYDFMESAPAEYLNVLPYEVLCNKMGYDIDYRADENTVTLSLRFESKIKHDGFLKTPPADIFSTVTPASMAEYLIVYLFSDKK